MSLRFVLDEDVPHSVASTFRAVGHEAWTVTDAGLATSTDTAVAAYACEARAVLVTMDKRFVRWIRRKTICSTVCVDSSEPACQSVVERFIMEIARHMERARRAGKQIVMICHEDTDGRRRDNPEVHAGRWPKPSEDVQDDVESPEVQVG